MWRQGSRRGLLLPLAVGLPLLGGLVLASVFALPNLLVPADLASSPERLVELRNDVRGTLIQAAGGLLLVLAAAATWRGLHINREGQITGAPPADRPEGTVHRPSGTRRYLHVTIAAALTAHAMYDETGPWTGWPRSRTTAYRSTSPARHSPPRSASGGGASAPMLATAARSLRRRHRCQARPTPVAVDEPSIRPPPPRRATARRATVPAAGVAARDAAVRSMARPMRSWPRRRPSPSVRI